MSRRAREDDEFESTHVQKSLRLTGDASRSTRPQRSTRGQGGAIARLQAIGDQIRPDLRPGVTARSNTREIPAEVPVNDMAPPIKQRRGVKSFLPVRDERPLTTMPPKPSFTLAEPGSTFGFRPQTSEPTAEDRTLNDRAVSGSTQRTETALDSEGDFEQSVRAEECQNTVGMDPDAEEHGADSYDMDPSANVNEDVFQPVDESQQTRPNGLDLSDEEAGNSSKPKRLYRRNNRVLSSDDEHDEDLLAPHDVSQQQNQYAPRYATNSAPDHSNAFIGSNPTDPYIDEVSPDEDDRRAVQFLNAQNDMHNEDVNSNEAEDDSQDVLEMYRQRNRSINPPPSCAPVGQSHEGRQPQRRNASTSRPPTVRRGDNDIPYDARREASTPPVTNTHSQPAHREAGTSRAADSLSQLSQRRDMHSVGKSGFQPASVSHRRTRTQKDPTPLNLGYYSGHWHNILVLAKAFFRCYIHTEIPFPERNTDSLNIAKGHLLEATARYQDNCGIIELDTTIYERYCNDMLSLIFAEGATTRGRMKTMGDGMITGYYQEAFTNCHSGQTAKLTKKLVEKFEFHMGGKDENGCTDNFSHPAVIDLSKRFYYGGKQDSLNFYFGDTFKTLPIPCLALVLTCLVNCLDEYQTGLKQRIRFEGLRYNRFYSEFLDTLEGTLLDEYHGPKLRKLLQRIADEGRSMFPVMAGSGDINRRTFRAVLD